MCNLIEGIMCAKLLGIWARDVQKVFFSSIFGSDGHFVLT